MLGSNLKKDRPLEDNPLPVPEGTLLVRRGRIGTVLPTRELSGIPLGARSVMVGSVRSLCDPKARVVETEHIWLVDQCQLVTGILAELAQTDPQLFVKKFMETEQKLKEGKL